MTELFREDRPEARTISRALGWLLNPQAAQRPVLVLDLSGEQAQGLYWNERIQALVIKQLLETLTRTAEHFYKNGRGLNTLVVIDEAHRLAPRLMADDPDHPARDVRMILVDAARTTRKYGLGWLFVSQTLASLHPEILRQLIGTGGAALNLYQNFKDPHSAFDAASRRYSFMTIGPVSPLSFAGTPLFFNAFNRIEDFLAANHLRV